MTQLCVEGVNSGSWRLVLHRQDVEWFYHFHDGHIVAVNEVIHRDERVPIYELQIQIKNPLD